MLRSLMLACALGAVAVAALDNGVGLTPALGWNSWNTFATNISEQLIRETADQIIQLGLADVGYEYIVIDDGWPNKTRDAQGRLQANSTIFPSGMAALADYIHSLGLKFGIYSDAGALTCGGYMGSAGHYQQDADTLAEWGVDYLKFDNCFIKQQDWTVEKYQEMRDALNATGREIYYSICNWGIVNPWRWGPETGNSWRTTADIRPEWPSITLNLGGNTGLAQFAQPGAWNDPDMLEVGAGSLTIQEQRAHFGLWAAVKSPLIIGTDLRKITPEALDILKNEEVVAVNQDPLGVPAELVWKQGALEIYAGPLEGGDRVVVMLNNHQNGSQYAQDNMTVWWELLGLQGGDRMMARDLFRHQDLGVFTDHFTGAVTLHDVLMLRLSPVDATRPYKTVLDGWRPWANVPMFSVPIEADMVYMPPEVFDPTSTKLCISSFGPNCTGFEPQNCTDSDCVYHTTFPALLPPISEAEGLPEALKGRRLLRAPGGGN